MTSVHRLTHWAAAAEVVRLFRPNKPPHWEVSWPRQGREGKDDDEDDDDDDVDDVTASCFQYCSVSLLPACPSSPACVPGLSLCFPSPMQHLPTGQAARKHPPPSCSSSLHTLPLPLPTPAALNTLLLCHAFRWLEACTLDIKTW